MTHRQAAVLGHPISHSLSPVLHRAAYAALGLDWSYRAVDLDESQVGEFLDRLDGSWAGLSVTAPLKQAVVPYLAEVSELARRVGAVNTILVRDDPDRPLLMGHNTDVLGIVAAFEQYLPGGVAGSVGIVGAGGTAAAALAAAELMGSAQTAVVARRVVAAQALVDALAPDTKAVAAMPWSDVRGVLAQERVIVTLPGDVAAPLVEQLPERPGTLLDVTYDPWPTTLAAAWQRRGGMVIPGHAMLLWQAVAQVRLMTGLEPPAQAMSDALEEAIAQR